MSLRNVPFELTPLTPAIGGAVAGLDLADPLSGETVAALKEALHDRLVLFFADQHLTPAAHRAFAAHFGPLHVHPIYPNVPETPEILVLDTDARTCPTTTTGTPTSPSSRRRRSAPRSTRERFRPPAATRSGCPPSPPTRRCRSRSENSSPG